MRRLFVVLLVIFAALTLLAASAGAALEEGHRITKVSYAGAEVHLEDGSIWKVPNRVDWDTTYNWLPGQPVAIRDGNKLLNVNSGEEVDVKRFKGPSAPKAAEQDKAAAQAKAMTKSAAPAPRAAAPAPAPGVAPAAMEKMEKRVDVLEDKLQIIDWRLRRIEDLLKTKP
ncbi:MAG: hypothetical protein V1797_08015 [Pseudomonadota bacterium]